MLNQPLLLIQTELQMLKALRSINNSVELNLQITALLLTQADLVNQPTWTEPKFREEYDVEENGHTDPDFEIDETYF